MNAPPAERERWLSAHPYLVPVARVDAAVSLALHDAGAESLPLPDLAAYRADYQAGIALLASTAAAIDPAPVVAALLAGSLPRLAGDAALPARFREGCARIAGSLRALPSPALAVRAALAGDAEGADAGHDGGLLRYLAWRGAAGALARAREAFAASRDEEGWAHGLCPTCGSAPPMAILVVDGEHRERRLACGSCGDRWRYQRVGCPHCGNEESDRLSLLEVEGEGGLRLDLCEACRGYLKTAVGERPPELLLSDWSSLHLDLLARERGYVRRGASLYDL